MSLRKSHQEAESRTSQAKNKTNNLSLSQFAKITEITSCHGLVATTTSLNQVCRPETQKFLEVHAKGLGALPEFYQGLTLYVQVLYILEKKLLPDCIVSQHVLIVFDGNSDDELGKRCNIVNDLAQIDRNSRSKSNSAIFGFLYFNSVELSF